MPASQDKIITKLRERRQIEADLRQMLTTSSNLEFRRRAQQIASLGRQVIPTITGNLDRADSRLLTAMGTVAIFLDRQEVVQALRWAMLQPQRSDQGRLGAMTILERFLGERPDDHLRASLVDAKREAVASLEAVVTEAESNPVALVEYVQGLDRQDPDVVLAVVRALGDLQGMQRVELLRMVAQDVREEIAAEALQVLGTIRVPEAAAAFQTLIPTCAPGLRSVAERLLRKFQFVGVEVTPLPPVLSEWRALISAVDGMGQQTVWFLQENPWAAHARFLNILLSDRAGAVEAVGHEQVSSLWLPPRRPAGHLHDIALPDASGAVVMLEASFDVGRRLVAEALAKNRETQIPVAGVLRLLSPWLWGYGGANSLPARALPELSSGDAALIAASGRLLAHPAFSNWTLRNDLTVQAAEEASRRPGWDLELWVKRLAGELLSDPMVAQALSRRLVAMSEWLLLAGDEDLSRLAVLNAQAIRGEYPQELAFVRALVRRDLELALPKEHLN